MLQYIVIHEHHFMFMFACLCFMGPCQRIFGACLTFIGNCIRLGACLRFIGANFSRQEVGSFLPNQRKKVG